MIKMTHHSEPTMVTFEVPAWNGTVIIPSMHSLPFSVARLMAEGDIFNWVAAVVDHLPEHVATRLEDSTVEQVADFTALWVDASGIAAGVGTCETEDPAGDGSVVLSASDKRAGLTVGSIAQFCHIAAHHADTPVSALIGWHGQITRLSVGED